MPELRYSLPANATQAEVADTIRKGLAKIETISALYAEPGRNLKIQPKEVVEEAGKRTDVTSIADLDES